MFKSFDHDWDDEFIQYWDEHPDRRLTKVRFAAIFWEKMYDGGKHNKWI